MAVRADSSVLFEVASALQKAIRRADERTAIWFGLEMLESGLGAYL